MLISSFYNFHLKAQLVKIKGLNLEKNMDSVEINSSGRTNPIDDEHVKILEELEDPSERKLFSIEKIKNLDIFKQNPRLFIRLQMCLDQNNYYEAHQAYKTLHFR